MVLFSALKRVKNDGLAKNLSGRHPGFRPGGDSIPEGEGREPVPLSWIPAFAGMTNRSIRRLFYETIINQARNTIFLYHPTNNPGD